MNASFPVVYRGVSIYRSRYHAGSYWFTFQGFGGLWYDKVFASLNEAKAFIRRKKHPEGRLRHSTEGRVA